MILLEIQIHKWMIQRLVFFIVVSTVLSIPIDSSTSEPVEINTTLRSKYHQQNQITDAFNWTDLTKLLDDNAVEYDRQLILHPYEERDDTEESELKDNSEMPATPMDFEYTTSPSDFLDIDAYLDSLDPVIDESMHAEILQYGSVATLTLRRNAHARRMRLLKLPRRRVQKSSRFKVEAGM